MTRQRQVPTYQRYRGKYARVYIGRKSIHLGRYDSEESHAKYRRIIAEWAAGQPLDDFDRDGVTVAEVLEGYRSWAEHFYGDTPRGRYRNLLPTIRTVRELYADLPADQFTPKKLKVVRKAFIDLGYTRSHVNTCTRRVIAMFAWAAEEELVSGSLVHSLREVRSLQLGRCDVREGKPVTTVEQSTIDATLVELTPIVADMVRLRLISGARPGELCSLTPGQIDRSADVWLYRPEQHKNRHRGHDRVVCFGPQAQAVLAKYLLRADDSPCFSPKESMRQHLDQKHEQRKTPMTCGNKPKPHRRCRAIEKVGDQYDVPAYRRAIHRACDRAGVARWSPNRLRHTRGTQVRAEYGLDGSQAILGHQHARVTELYSELNTAKAIDIARRSG